MTVDDFCRCTPLEFKAVYEGWAEREQRRERAAWERTRLECTTTLQPYSRRQLQPEDVMRFAWDVSAAHEESPLPPFDKGEKLTAKEIWERFERVKREMGME